MMRLRRLGVLSVIGLLCFNILSQYPVGNVDFCLCQEEESGYVSYVIEKIFVFGITHFQGNFIISLQRTEYIKKNLIGNLMDFKSQYLTLDRIL